MKKSPSNKYFLDFNKILNKLHVYHFFLIFMQENFLKRKNEKRIF